MSPERDDVGIVPAHDDVGRRMSVGDVHRVETIAVQVQREGIRGREHGSGRGRNCRSFGIPGRHRGILAAVLAQRLVPDDHGTFVRESLVAARVIGMTVRDDDEPDRCRGDARDGIDQGRRGSCEARVHEHEAIGAGPDHDVAACPRDDVQTGSNDLHSQIGHGFRRIDRRRRGRSAHAATTGAHSAARTAKALPQDVMPLRFAVIRALSSR